MSANTLLTPNTAISVVRMLRDSFSELYQTWIESSPHREEIRRHLAKAEHLKGSPDEYRRTGEGVIYNESIVEQFEGSGSISPTPGFGLRKRRRAKCGECTGCLCKVDCQECKNCLDMPKYGGLGKKKKGCIKRECVFLREERIKSQRKYELKMKQMRIGRRRTTKKAKRKKTHKSSARSDKLLVCEVCNKTFSGPSGLFYHRVKKHGHNPKKYTRKKSSD